MIVPTFKIYTQSIHQIMVTAASITPGLMWIMLLLSHSSILYKRGCNRANSLASGSLGLVMVLRIWLFWRRVGDLKAYSVFKKQLNPSPPEAWKA